MRVATVIPAFNEEKNLPQVLNAIKDCRDLTEVIVVNDGSSDRTSEVAKEFGCKVIDLPSNLGKGAAVMAGVKITDAPYIMLLDADLIGLRPDHIRSLLEPIEQGRAEMTIGIFKSGRTLTNLSQRLTPFLNGQRVIKRDIFQKLPVLDVSRYGVDLILSRYAKKIGLKVARVELEEITQVMKEEKLGFVPGLIARLKMYWEVLLSLNIKLPPHP